MVSALKAKGCIMKDCRAINSLPLEEQKLVWARFFDGMSLRQYAQSKGLAHTTVHGRERSILKKLKKYPEF
jgi:DNA-directed RNA polymerase specialized sigma24 family protein